MTVRWQVAERDAAEGDSIKRWALHVVKGHYHTFQPQETWTPAINVYEDERNVYVIANLAGVGSSSIELEFTDGKLILSGHRTTPPPPEVHGKVCLLHMEIDHGPFRRIIDIPTAVQDDRIRAVYRTGQLLVTLPKQI